MDGVSDEDVLFHCECEMIIVKYGLQYVIPAQGGLAELENQIGDFLHLLPVVLHERADILHGFSMSRYKPVCFHRFYFVQCIEISLNVVDISQGILIENRPAVQAVCEKYDIIGCTESNHMEEMAGQGNDFYILGKGRVGKIGDRTFFCHEKFVSQIFHGIAAI